MSNLECPKCGSGMDSGHIPTYWGGAVNYKSDSQGILSRPLVVEMAKACLKCGYVELYLDPKKLKNTLAK